MKKLIQLFRFVWNHPLNLQARLTAIVRVIRWQIASRLMLGPIALPFVNGTHLFATRGMTGATANWYCGLHEYEDMSFVLDVMQAGDLFVDVGANIGSYSILAGVGAGADVLAFEPIPQTFKALERNILLNDLSGRVKAMNVGIGSKRGKLCFSADRDTVNHVLAEGEDVRVRVQVDVLALDDVLRDKRPALIKIDVEGFESEVLAGAKRVLARPDLLGVIVELNGSGDRYGQDDDQLHLLLQSCGFESFRYEPAQRKLISLEGKRNSTSNTLYLKNKNRVQARIPFMQEGTHRNSDDVPI